MKIEIKTCNEIENQLKSEYEEISNAMKFSLTEYCLSGFSEYSDFPFDRNISAWIPGDNPNNSEIWLKNLQKNGKYFRFFFPEMFYEPAIKAQKLFTGKHIGNPTSLLIKVMTHKGRLFFPGHFDQKDFWLKEPVLNRIPLAIWLMGPVHEVKFTYSKTNHAEIIVIILKHIVSPRLTIIELTISDEFLENNKPAIYDKFECTGSDGIISVNGIWSKNNHLPRLSIKRGSVEIIEKELCNDFESIFFNAVKESIYINKNTKSSFKFAFDYLEACKFFL